MCSIVGAAGPIADLSNKLQEEFHEFLSTLFTMAEVRGRDAAGFWVWRGDHYVYEKRPIPAEDLIKRSPRWKSLRFHPGTLYLLHTRAATEGDPNDNINNHPHIGEHSVMVHNGCIYNFEQIVNQQSLALNSDCDSEVLLKLTEKKEEIEDGLKHMFQVTHEHTGSASIAVAVVDRRTPDRIFCTRNSSNPLYLYRSDKFNCTFFVSTEEIFEMALEMVYHIKDPRVIGAHSVNVLPHNLYELKEDGSFSSHHLITLISTTRSFSYVGVEDDDDDDDTTPKHYGHTIIGGLAYQYDIKGVLKPVVQETTKTPLVIDSDEYDLESEDLVHIQAALEMSEEQEDDLIAYLQQKAKELA